jgi:formate/nitrite transporter
MARQGLISIKVGPAGPWSRSVTPAKETSMSEHLSESFEFDAYKPAQIASRVEAAGVAKARQDVLTTLMLSVLAGAYISFGALFFTIGVTGSDLGWGPTQLLGGVAFSLGLILVIIAGAELFTGNALVVMAWADRRISLPELLRNWGLVYAGNLVGAVATAVLVVLSGVLDFNGGGVGVTAAAIASTKLELGLVEAFFRGILCNVLVCLAVWLSFAGRSVIDKVAAIVFPITAFVGAGFEHSVANMYVMPVAMLAGLVPLDMGAMIANLVVVSAGNVVGGAVLVALVYWVIFARHGSGKVESPRP